MAIVELEHLTKVYDNGFKAVNDLNLTIGDGEFLVLVGPSGCGKSTALRMVAGLEDISGGEIIIDGTVMNDVPSRDRDVAMVFQSYALYPHMTVGENIGFGLKLRKMPKLEINRRVTEAAAMLGLDELLDRRPKALSGGQRQRVAMGRAIVRQPKAFLMDEPLSNLDAKLRVQMRGEIARLQHEMNVTTIYVTHDQVEAMTMGDRVAVMRRGVLLQVAGPQDLYDNPVNLFVAGFMGSPPMNMCEAKVEVIGGEVWVRIGEQRLHVDAEDVAARPRLREYDGRIVAMGVRAEDLSDASVATSAPMDRRLRAKAFITEALGSEVMVHFTLDVAAVNSELALDTASLEAQKELLATSLTGTPWVASFGPRARVRPGQDIEMAVDTRNLHFFDLETGLTIKG